MYCYVYTLLVFFKWQETKQNVKASGPLVRFANVGRYGNRGRDLGECMSDSRCVHHPIALIGTRNRTDGMTLAPNWDPQLALIVAYDPQVVYVSERTVDHRLSRWNPSVSGEGPIGSVMQT